MDILRRPQNVLKKIGLLRISEFLHHLQFHFKAGHFKAYHFRACVMNKGGEVYFPRSSTWCILFNFFVQTQLQVTIGYWRSSRWLCWSHVLSANLATRLVWKTTLETGINIIQIHSFLHSNGDGSFSCHRYWFKIIHKKCWNQTRLSKFFISFSSSNNQLRIPNFCNEFFVYLLFQWCYQVKVLNYITIQTKKCQYNALHKKVKNTLQHLKLGKLKFGKLVVPWAERDIWFDKHFSD